MSTLRTPAWFVHPSEVLPLWQASSLGEEPVPHEIPRDVEIVDHVVGLIPESVARENLVFPLADSSDALLVAAAVPVDRETIDKLQFILNRRVLAVPTSSDWIERKLYQHFGPEDRDVDSAG